MGKLNGTQKAAVLMVAVGDDAAANIFKYLEEDEIQTISKEIALTKHVQPEVMDEVMEEFHTMSLAKTYISQGGIEYAKKLLIKSVGPEAARKIIDRLTKALESSAGFSSIERANPQQLSKFIQNEHPQTIALILAHLNASQAGDLIASLPALTFLQNPSITRILSWPPASGTSCSSSTISCSSMIWASPRSSSAWTRRPSPQP